MISHPYTPCQIIFLVNPPPGQIVIAVTKVWTTSLIENVKVQGEKYQNVTVAEFKYHRIFKD